MSDKRLLLVDDEPNILKSLKRLLHRDGYTILTAESGIEGLQQLENNPINVIISDYRMPGMTGVEFLAQVKQKYPDITRIVLSGFSDMEVITTAINQGNIYKFITKPWDDTQLKLIIKEAFEYNQLRIENIRLTKELQIANAHLLQKNQETSGLLEQVINHITDGIIVVDQNKMVIFSNPSALTLLIDHYKVLPGDYFKLPFKPNQIHHLRLPRSDKGDLHIEAHTSSITHEGKEAFLITLRDQSAIERIYEEKLRSRSMIKKILLQTVKTMGLTIEKRDPYTAGHQNKVAKLAVEIGKYMGLDDNQLEGLKVGGLVHDIGKISIPSEILNRPCLANEHERLVIQDHSRIGYEILSTIDFPWPVAEIALQHHEYIDGSGYPRGLVGDEMILEAKIISVANRVVAMSEYRPYRNSSAKADIIRFLEQESGKKFEPDIVKACTEILFNDLPPFNSDANKQ